MSEANMSDNDPVGQAPKTNEEGEPFTIPNATSMPSMDPLLPGMDDLTERFSQQQVMISQLKEMVIAEEAARSQKMASTRLKVEKCASQLARIRDRAKMTKLKNVSGSATSSPRAQSENISSSDLDRDRQLFSDSDERASDNPISNIPIEVKIPPPTPSPSLLMPLEDESKTKSKSKTPNREVTKILYHQIREHKAMIAERTKNEKELEMALAKIKKQLEESQNQSADILQLGLPKTKAEFSSISTSEDKTESNKIINELRNRIIQLEGNILDLQETCKEKDSVIDSRTKAITLMSADLSKKGKNTLDLLDDTKEQMQAMQQNFATMENNMKQEKQQIIDELEVCKNRVIYLEEANSILEGDRFKLSIENSSLEERLTAKEVEIQQLNVNLNNYVEKINELSAKINDLIDTDTPKEEEKGSEEISQMVELSDKIKILEDLNLVLRQSNIELKEKLSPTPSPEKELPASPRKKEESPKPVRKTNKPLPKGKGAQKFKTPLVKPETSGKTIEDKDPNKDLIESVKKLETIIENLNKQVLDKEILLSQKDSSYQLLEQTLKELEVSQKEKEIVVQNIVTEETISPSIESESTDDNARIPVEDSNESLQEQLNECRLKLDSLSKDLSTSNKNMIEVKASHKAKVKRMQKTIDDFSKVSESNAEVVRLQSEVHRLTQRVAELEEDKGNLQLHLVDYDSGRVSDSQLHAKLLESEMMAEERLKAIEDLESQKFELVHELHTLKQQIAALEDKVADLTFFESEHVSNEMKSVQLEENLDVLKVENAKILKEIEVFRVEKNELNNNIESLIKEKAEINSKLEHYIQENIDLIDRLEKLSAEKVSSAESIEMVESLTSQEKMEIEQYEKTFDSSQTEKPDHSEISEAPHEPARRESYSQITPEHTDLLAKIDLFTQERHEVMEKIDHLNSENNSLNSKLEQLLQEKSSLEEHCKNLKQETVSMSANIKIEEDRVKTLSGEIETLNHDNQSLKNQIQELVDSRNSRTEEVIVSETVEVEDTIEKEFVEVPTQQLQPIEPKDKSPKTPGGSNKNTKNFTKEILRLKNIVKHQESEISKLKLQLDEMQEAKIQNDAMLSEKLSLSSDLEKARHENISLMEQIVSFQEEKEFLSNKLVELENCNKTLVDEQQAHSTTNDSDIKRTLEEKIESQNEVVDQLNISLQDVKHQIAELNKIVYNKDKEISELKMEVAQICEMGNRLKSTLEEERALALQNKDIIKNFDMECKKLTHVLSESEPKFAEAEKKLNEAHGRIEVFIVERLEIDNKIKDLEETLNEKNKQIHIMSQDIDGYIADIQKFQIECSTKDEEIHEIKLQLRKESIENDKLINKMKEVEQTKTALQSDTVQLKESCEVYLSDISKIKEEYSALDNKFKEQHDKLKKYAANFKKKTALCSELETKVTQLTSDLLSSNKMNEDANVNIQMLQQQLSVSNAECNQVKSEIQQTTSSNNSFHTEQITNMENEIENLKSKYEQAHSEMASYKMHNEALNSKIKEGEEQMQQAIVENSSLSQKIMTLMTELDTIKLSVSSVTTLESEIVNKQSEIAILLDKLEDLQSEYSNYKYGQEAKLQESDVYIESLQTELVKHKERISRLEDSVSTMEERRSSLERKADHLVTKLHEKDKAFSESYIQEDKLEKRLAALMAHDDLVQKQLEETQNENVDLSDKVKLLSESKKEMQSELDILRCDVAALKKEASDSHILQEERLQAFERISYLENELKRMSVEYSEILKNKVAEYEYLESEFHSQINNAETQRRLSKEHHDELRDEMKVQENKLKEALAENDWLKTENENLNLQKLHFESQKSFAQVPFDAVKEFTNKEVEKEELNNLQTQVHNLSATLKDKELELEKYQQHTLQLQMAISGNTPAKDSQSEDNAKSIQQLRSSLSEKDQEIIKLDCQFKSCLSQLSEVVEAEKKLKDINVQLSNVISEKDSIINSLQNEQFAKHEKNLSIEPEIVEVKSVRQMANLPAGQQKVDENAEADILKYLQDQIVTDEVDIKAVPDTGSHMIRGFQHDPPEVVTRIEDRFGSLTAPNTSVFDELIQPKTTYVCYEEKQDVAEKSKDNIFNEDEEWGWSGQDAQLEEEHLKSQVAQNLSQGVSDNRVVELELIIKCLTEDKSKLSEDLLQSQEKLTKAMKKLKEFKVRNDRLTNEVKTLKGSSSVNMLDDAIQDELLLQIKNFETKIDELKTEIGKEKLEKEGLLKRIDVLTSANERLMEMKERQDIDMQICRSNINKLNEKLQNFEWTVDSTSDQQEDSKSKHVDDAHLKGNESNSLNNEKINSLKDKIKDLEADNEELQTMLEEQHARNSVPKTVDISDDKIKIITAELDEIKNENRTLKDAVSTLKDDKNEINQLLSSTQNENIELKKDLESQKNKEVDNLEFETMRSENIDLKTKLEDLIKEYYEFQDKYSEIATDRDRLEIQFNSLLKDKNDLELQNSTLTDYEISCKAELNKLVYEKEEICEKYEALLKKSSEAKDTVGTEEVISLSDQLHKLSEELNVKNSELIAIKQLSEDLVSQKTFLQSNIDKLNEENSVLLSNLAELRNNVTDAIDQRGTEVAEMWKHHLAMRESEFENVEMTLRQEIFDLGSRLAEISNQVTGENVEECQVQKNVPLEAFESEKADIDKEMSESQKILNDTIAEKNEYKHLCETQLPSAIKKYEDLLAEYQKQNDFIQQKDEELVLIRAKMKQLENVISSQNMSSIDNSNELESVIKSQEAQITNYVAIIQDWEIKFNTKVQEYHSLLQSKDAEFYKLSQDYVQTQQKYEDCDMLRQQLSDAETKLSTISHENEVELANMRLKWHAEKTSFETTIADLTEKVKQLDLQLEAKINEIKTVNAKNQELQVLVDEEANQMSELRTALESQEIEIVTLSENLKAQMGAYEQVSEAYKLERNKPKAERHVSFSKDTKPGDPIDERPKLSTTEMSPDMNPRADLDLALYMLHQRDVRCEELTVELMQLLEERDTLQLKLSTAIRSNEELRLKQSLSQIQKENLKETQSGTSVSQDSLPHVPENKDLPETHTSIESSVHAEIPTDLKSLETKLSQLHNVGHSRDVRLKDEREDRQRQMELLHRDVQNLPPEAAARLREAHFTLTRDTQSTSTVLLNWLWGRTTPKVVHM